MTIRPPATLAARARTRRRARTLVTAAGAVNLLSALTPPVAARLSFLDAALPLNARESAAATAAVSGVLLVVLGGGLRRGHRRAWTAAIVVLAFTVVANLMKGLDLEEAGASTVLVAYLIARRDAFGARTDPTASRRVARAVGIIGAAALAAEAVAVAVAASKHRPIDLHTIYSLVTDIASWLSPIGGSQGHVTPPIMLVAIATLGAGAWALLRPVRMPTSTPADRDRARDIVRAYGSGTLDYFALRDDKHHWFHNHTVVAYRMFNGVCLVSPDPVGPADERDGAWCAFQRYAETRGWSTAVLGATSDWLALYQRAGMRAIYLGDEAIVDVQAFGLEGGRFNGLRQAVNRVARHGYTLDLMDPNALDTPTRQQLVDLAKDSRHGDSERGFSMTLGRLFDPADDGLLLAVVRGPNSTPAAFCQFVPAPAIGGYSLDLMRRSTAGHPNGLLDFLLVGTIVALAERGTTHLSLNFAALRTSFADGDRTHWTQRFQRAVLGRLSRSLQIESLWRFNAKYDPTWSPRYVLFDGRDQIGPVGVAALRAEQAVRDVPLVGRVLAFGRPARLES